MVSKKQKIAKIFKEDEEIAGEMLKEDEQKQGYDWKRIAHFFRIHCFDKIIRQKDEKQVVKCKYCGSLRLTTICFTWKGTIFGLLLLLAGLIFGVKFSFDLISGFSSFSLAGFLSCILSLYIAFKRFLERNWMD